MLMPSPVPSSQALGKLTMQLSYLFYFPLPKVLSCHLHYCQICHHQHFPHLVLPSPPDVPADVQLLLCQVILAQQVIELIHGQANQGLLGNNHRLRTFNTGRHLHIECYSCLLCKLFILAKSLGSFLGVGFINCIQNILETSQIS